MILIIGPITIPGTPCAQGRGRAFATKAGIRVFDPKKSRDWKATAQQHMILAWKGNPPLAQPVSLTVRAYWLCPRSKYLKRSPRPEQYRPKRPDGSNVLKAVEDAANGILFLDDSQVVKATVEKFQAAQGEPARVEVRVETVLE